MATAVDFWFDCVCPWAWMTSRWMGEVEKVRDVTVTWHPMSLSVLNEGRDLSEEYAELMERAWLPARVVTGALVEHGEAVVKPLYDAIGTRLHPRGERDVPAAVAAAVDGGGLPADLIAAAERGLFDEALRASHQDGIGRVGEDVGTPVIAVGEIGFFGPVVTPAPKGEDAGRLWDGVLLVSSTPGFYELKRTRDEGPVFD